VTATTPSSSSLFSSADAYEALLQRFVAVSRLAEIIAMVNSARSEAELAETVAAELCEAFEAEVAFVLVRGLDEVEARVVGAHGVSLEQYDELVSEPICLAALAEDEPRSHAGDDLLGVGARTLALAPFAGERGERVVIGVARFYDQAFDEAELALLESVSKSTGHALEKAWLAFERELLLARERDARAEAEGSAERLSRLQRITDAVLSQLSLDETLNELLNRIRETLGADTASILLLGERGEQLVVRAATGLAEDRDRQGARLPVTEGLPGRVLRDRRPVVVEDVSEARAVGGARATPIRSLVALPLLVEGRAIGVLEVGTLERRRFSQEDARLLELAADRAAVGIENARLYHEAEERAHSARVLEYVADGVFLLDREGIIRLWNPAAETITGLAKAAVLDRPAEEVIPGLTNFGRLVSDGLGRSASSGRAETVPVEIGGRELWLSISGADFSEGTVYAFRDLTEMRRLEELKAEFLSTVSHELRTPLAAVHGAAVTLQRRDLDVDDATRARLLAIISDQANRLARLVDDILLASQIDSARIEVARETVDPVEVARDVVEAARTHAPEAVSIELVTPRSAPAIAAVAADADRLRQVLANVVENAVKFSPEGGRVDVRVTAGERHVVFSVRDEGVGIPPAEQERVFEKFYRLDPNMTRGVSGTGLGLYISRELVRQMNGRIWVVSGDGKGSTFFVEVPLAES
jgi:PAS domain S-box-containing protein